MEFDLETDRDGRPREEGLRMETIESRLGEPLLMLSLCEYLLDLRERTEDRRSNCSCSEMREGPEGRGGRGAVGGPVGGGFEPAEEGVGGMWEGGAGKEERMRGTGVRLEGRGVGVAAGVGGKG